MVLTVIIYLVWYTFKNDIFGIPVNLARKMCAKCSAPSENADVYYIDKGYFGIVTYFVQVHAVMKLSISLDSDRNLDNLLSRIKSYIELGLNFELTYFSNDTCALVGLTTTYKMMFRLLFLFGIFLSWYIVFLCLFLLKQTLTVYTAKIERFNMKLMCGLVEIIKYTYLGFTSIVFYSLTCTSVAGSNIWFHDGSVLCYGMWQTAMIFYCIFYILPCPFLIYLGKKLLHGKKISQ